MSLTFERKLPIILFFVFLMLTTIGFVFYQSSVSTQRALDWEKHAVDVMKTLDETVALSMDVQTAVFGFIYTGNETYLDPLNRGKPKISQNIGRLRQLFADQPEQTERVGQMEQLLKEYFDEAGRKVDIRKSLGREAAMKEIPWQDGKRLLDRIRQYGDEVKKVETVTLQEREQALAYNFGWTVWILIASSLAGIISLGFANIVVFSEIRKPARRPSQIDRRQRGP